MNINCLCLRERHIYSVNIYSFLIVSLFALHPKPFPLWKSFPEKWPSHPTMRGRVLSVLAQISNILINRFFLDYETESEWVLFMNTAFGWKFLHRQHWRWILHARLPKISKRWRWILGARLPKISQHWWCILGSRLPKISQQPAVSWRVVFFCPGPGIL